MANYPQIEIVRCYNRCGNMDNKIQPPVVAVAEFVVRNTDSGSKTPFLKMPKAIFKKPAALLLTAPVTPIPICATSWLEAMIMKQKAIA